MFQALTPTHCLYHLDQQTLDQFLELAATYSFEEDIKTLLSLGPIDNCAVVLQIWCMLNEDHYHFAFDTDKMMAYRSNHYCLKLLNSDKNIQAFLKAHLNEQRVKYVLAYYLAYEIIQWIYALLLQDETGLALIETNKTRNYFLFSEEEQLIHTENHPFYTTQRYVTQTMAFDYQHSHRYQTHIQRALDRTKRYLNQF